MKTFLVANPKGGSGKTTLATNLAGYFASNGKSVVLADMDRQESSLNWLERRSANLPRIQGLNGRNSDLDNVKADIMVIDSPAGLRGDKLSDAVKAVDWVIVPMQSSIFDINATQDFLEILKAEKAVRKERTFVAMVGMRVTARTKAANNLESYLAESGFPVMGFLRNAQVYMRAAEAGASIFDMTPSKVKQDITQWDSLLDWIKAA
ncbi:MAG: AAA family ATPase [Methylophilaceae bacterium]|nr:AAA family ATPase [Methylophilaceae bacterium]